MLIQIRILLLDDALVKFPPALGEDSFWRDGPLVAESAVGTKPKYSAIEGLGAELVAISVDGVWSHMAFANARQLQFPLPDDRPRGTTARAYGVYDARRQVAKRALFVIDPLGKIVWSAVFPDAVDPGVDGILTALEGLQDTPPTEGQPT